MLLLSANKKKHLNNQITDLSPSINLIIANFDYTACASKYKSYIIQSKLFIFTTDDRKKRIK